MRHAGCVAARPAGGCSRLQSFICCGSTIPQIWPGLSSADLEARRAGTVSIHGVRLRVVNLHSARSSVMSGRRGSSDIRFMAGGGRPKADHVGFLLSAFYSPFDPAPHEATCGQMRPRQRARQAPLIVLRQAPAARHPGESLLHDPAAIENGEPFLTRIRQGLRRP